MAYDGKIFIIGFNKCATKAFHEFFAGNGLTSVHWDRNLLAQSIWEQFKVGKDPVGYYPGVQVFSDIECVTRLELPPIEIYLHFRKLFDWYPDATFILNTRSVDRWVISRIYHMDGRYLDCWKHHYGTRDVSEVILKWRQSWADHHAGVREFFSDKPDSWLEYDLEKDDPTKFCRHFEGRLSLDVSHFSIVGEGRKAPTWTGTDIVEAEAAQRAVLEIDPDFAGAHGLLSLIAEHRGDRSQSLHHAETAYRLMPDIPEFEENLKRLQQQE